MSSYIPVIGLEIHAELLTQSKVFCTCGAQFGGSPNSRCCPVCTGMPGTLPVINQTAVEYAVKAGMALGCDISKFSVFDRKNYFYPDLPKAYQISQLYYPLCLEGKVAIDTPNGQKYIRINHIHLEEDAGKLVHDDFNAVSLADYNRCGIPLVEIVTEPDISSAEEAKAFIEKVMLLLQYAGVSDCKMEEGSLRCDVNVSIMRPEDKELGTRAEIKNMNSLKSITRAINYEIKRQTRLLDAGKKVVQETRRFNENKGETSSMRSKENAHDYRYFPEPDILQVNFTDEMLELFFTYCSLNVVMMTIPVFMWAKRVNIRSERMIKALSNLTLCGFGVYMIHYFFTGPSVVLMRAAGVPLCLQIPVAAVVAFGVSWFLVAMAYRCFGKKTKWVMG